jgi:hypothetical protein
MRLLLTIIDARSVAGACWLVVRDLNHGFFATPMCSPDSL